MNSKPVILFDGVCNFCNRMVNFTIRQDKKRVFLFGALQSAAGQRLTKEHNINWQSDDSFVMIENGKAYKRSRAALKVYSKLPWYWKWTQLFWIVPTFIRDAAYDFVAKRRYNWFGKTDTCMIPTPDVRQRFIE